MTAHRRYRATPLVVLAAATLAAAGGAWQYVRQQAPQLDRSTPSTQGGFRVLAVQAVPLNGNSALGGGASVRQVLGNGTQTACSGDGLSCQGAGGGVGLWLRAPGGASLGRWGGLTGPHKATVRASTGEVAEAQCTVTAALLPNGPCLLHVRPPAVWPDDVRYLDLTVGSAAGRSARWRITNLPRSIHMLPPGTPVRPAVVVGGVRVTGYAWWTNKAPGSPSENVSVGTRQQIQAPARPGVLRENVIRGTTLEWAPAGMPANPTQDIAAVEVAPGNTGGIGSGYAVPGRRFQHLAAVMGAIREYAAVDETVTFRNLMCKRGADGSCRLTIPRDQTVVTPSGIRVTILAPKPADYVWPGELALRYRMPGSLPASGLPGSRLAKQYRGPFQVQMRRLPKGLVMGAVGSQPALFLRPAPRKSGPLPPLTFVVRHRVNLAEHPYRLTMPIADSTPAAFLPPAHGTKTRSTGARRNESPR